MGWCSVPFFVSPKLERQRPTLLRQQVNTREATEPEILSFLQQCGSTVGELDSTNWKFAVVIVVHSKYIANLKQIKKWRPGSGEPLVEIQWTAEAKGMLSSLLNGNHRWEATKWLLEAEFKRMAAYEQWIESYKSQPQRSEEDDANARQAAKDMAALWKVISAKSNFAVELYDECESAFSFFSIIVNERPV